MSGPSPLRSFARRARHELVDWVRSSLPALAFIVAFRVGVVDAYHVPTGSMRRRSSKATGSGQVRLLVRRSRSGRHRGLQAAAELLAVALGPHGPGDAR